MLAKNFVSFEIISKSSHISRSVSRAIFGSRAELEPEIHKLDWSLSLDYLFSHEPICVRASKTLAEPSQNSTLYCVSLLNQWMFVNFNALQKFLAPFNLIAPWSLKCLSIVSCSSQCNCPRNLEIVLANLFDPGEFECLTNVSCPMKVEIAKSLAQQHFSAAM